jgi:hypothetical protein
MKLLQLMHELQEKTTLVVAATPTVTARLMQQTKSQENTHTHEKNNISILFKDNYGGQTHRIGLNKHG